MRRTRLAIASSLTFNKADTQANTLNTASPLNQADITHKANKMNKGGMANALTKGTRLTL